MTYSSVRDLKIERIVSFKYRYLHLYSIAWVPLVLM